MPIEWSSARTPNFFELYQQSFEQGRQYARERALEAKQYRGGGDAEKDQDGQDHLPTWRDEHRQALDALQGHEQASAHQHAEVLGGLVTALLGVSDLRQRLTMAQHAAEQFQHFGVDPRNLTIDDVSDGRLKRELEALSHFLSGRLDRSPPQDWSGFRQEVVPTLPGPANNYPIQV